MTNRGGNAPRVSVIIVSWNGLDHVDTCLEALERQSMRAFETILVDNASEDGTLEHVQRRFPGVRVVSLNTNQGFAGGNIAGYKEAGGSYIALLNNDTLPEATWLASLVQCADQHPGVGMVASHMTDWESARTDSAGDAVNILGRAHQRHKGQQLTELLQEVYVFSACAGAALYKREMIEDVGFLDESFFMNVEDTDLAFRAQLRGWKAIFCPAAVVRHRVSASQVAGSPANVYYNTRNYLWSYVKNMPSRLILKYGWLLIADLTLKGLVATRHGSLRAYLRGLRDGVLGVPEKLLQRKHIQTRRIIPISELEDSLTYPRLLRRLTGNP